MLKDFKINELPQYIYYFLLMFSMLFARSFVGLTFFGFRLGELIIGCSFLLSVVLFLPRKYLPNKISENNLLIILRLLILSVFVVALFTSSPLTSLYFVRSSSYVWSITFIFFGIYFLDFLRNNNYFIALLSLAPLFVYLFSTGRYPNSIMSFFMTWSDKFQFIKGSDLMLTYIVVTLSLIKFLSNKFLSLTYLFLISAAFFPLLLFNSRGAFLAGAMYFIFQLIYERKFFWKNKVFTLVLGLIGYFVFYSSVLNVYGEFNFVKVNEATKPNIVTEKVTQIAKQKKTVETFRSFYIEDGRLYSDDNTTNWRLDIWQDLYHYMDDENMVMTGHGYKSIFPIMLDPTAPGRLGRDGLNENVHNYFANIFGRGGIFQLLLFLYFYLKLISLSKELNGNYQVIGYLIPVMANSFFDANMEGVQYPFIFYSFLAVLFLSKKNEKSSVDY